METKRRKELLADPHVQERLYAASPLLFATENLSGPPEAPYLGRFIAGPHHLEWERLSLQHKKTAVLAARDHGKSQFYSFALSLWRSVYWAGREGFIFSSSQGRANEILDDVRVEVESNPKLTWLIPPKKRKWSASCLRFTNGSTIYAAGWGTKVRGGHPYWAVCDDVLNDESLYSATVRRKQIDYFHSVITNMVVDGGHTNVVGTPFSTEDLLYGDLRKNPAYVWRQFPALGGPNQDQPLWPARYSLERLLARKIEIGSIRFSREFGVEPIADDSSLFPSWLFAGEPVEQRSLRLGMPSEYWRELGVTIFIGVDLAMSASAGGDFFVVFVLGVDGNKNRWIIDIDRGHGVGFQEQLARINRLGQLYDPAIVAIESNQLQRVWGDELIRTSDLPIQKFITTASKHTLENGLPSLRIRLENRKWRIPRGDKNSVEMTDLWQQELQAHAWVDGKVQCVSGHDDLAMASWITDQTAQKGAFSFGVGEATGAEGEDAELDALVRELQGEILQDATASATDPAIGGMEPAPPQTRPQDSSLAGDIDVPMGKTLDELFGGMPGLGQF